MGHLDVSGEEWNRALAEFGTESAARAAFCNRNHRKFNTMSVGTLREQQDQHVRRMLEGCPLIWREPASVCVGEFLRSGDHWRVAEGGLISDSGTEMGWEECARIGVKYLAHFHALSTVSCSPQTRYTCELIDRRLASENPVSHDIAMRQLDNQDVRDYGKSLRETASSRERELRDQYQLRQVSL